MQTDGLTLRVKQAQEKANELDQINRQKKLEVQLLSQEIQVSNQHTLKAQRQNDFAFNEFAVTKSKLYDVTNKHEQARIELMQEIQKLAECDQVFIKYREQTEVENQQIVDCRQIIEALCNEKFQLNADIKELGQYCGVRANFDFNKCLCNNCA
ncbi:Conserved_hypothetical protein [Hexamita inflata]|uniref:Uncharacterized protein n=1 Tax=Hexamita inflata TaxID=28002 RepID=A0AA86RBB9_9EUKA|nr:Conserved hypothetical protein [Hexamita inflata]